MPAYKTHFAWLKSWFVKSAVRRCQVALEQPSAVAHIDVHFLSFSVDISVIAGGQWWEGSQRVVKGLGGAKVEPLALNDLPIDPLVQGLLPAYLRVGGSEADKIHYFSNQSAIESDGLLLSRDMWDGVQAFVARHQLKFSFTFKYGLFRREHHGRWRGDEVSRLLAYSKKNGHRLDICELGNELNAYWAFHGLQAQPSAERLAADYLEFSGTVHDYYPHAQIIGPGSAFWPRLGETIKPFSNLSHKFLKAARAQGVPLTIVDWHYYPFQSRRAPIRTRAATKANMLRPRALNEYRRYCHQLQRLRDLYFPGAALWTGESGSAQCGGEPKLSDRFASCFWWLDQLGLGALNGQQVIIRQSLIGGDYGLIDRQTLKPRPDYWASWLWKQLMGESVFKIAALPAHLRGYCHYGRGEWSKVVVMINLSHRPWQLEFGDNFDALPIAQFALTAKKLTSKKVRINGRRAKIRAGRTPALSEYATGEVSQILPGRGIVFWCFQ